MVFPPDHDSFIFGKFWEQFADWTYSLQLLLHQCLGASTDFYVIPLSSINVKRSSTVSRGRDVGNEAGGRHYNKAAWIIITIHGGATLIVFFS